MVKVALLNSSQEEYCAAGCQIQVIMITSYMDDNDDKVNRHLARHSPRAKANNALACNTVSRAAAAANQGGSTK